MINIEQYLTKRNILIFCVVTYVLLSAVSLVTSHVSDTPSHCQQNCAADEDSPEGGNIFHTIGKAMRAMFCPLRILIYLAWFAFVVLLFILALICDLITIFNFSLLSGYFHFVGNATSALISFFESIC